MSMQKKLKVRGLVMLAGFFVLLGVIFTPVFPGNQNGLDYMDNLFNMISKGSVYFIPASKEDSKAFAGTTIEVSFSMVDDKQAKSTAELYRKSGAEASVDGTTVNVKGDVAAILQSSLEDADYLFNNNGTPITAKYGIGEKETLYYWWKSFGGVTKDLNMQKKFKEAKIFDAVKKKAIEPAYNYYGVESGHYKDYLFLIVAALAFYVIYTLWYGFGIMYLFEGFGMNISH
ncbi:MAG: hypothetical protein V2I36_13165 [Desulfopila sp.]|jgi:hypothetical protein|nr:hypothetical protein [Desulfopila sp.]